MYGNEPYYRFSVLLVEFSPDGSTFVTVSNNKIAHLWESKTGRQLKEFIGHTDWISSLAFSHDGQTILSGSYDGTARLWDIQTGRQLKEFKGKKSCCNSIVFSLDDTIILIKTPTKIVLFNVQSEQLLACLTQTNDSNFLKAVFSPNGNTILTRQVGGKCCLWDIYTGDKLYTFDAGSSAKSVKFSLDGNNIIIGGNKFDSHCGEVQLWKRSPNTPGCIKRRKESALKLGAALYPFLGRPQSMKELLAFIG